MYFLFGSSNILQFIDLQCLKSFIQHCFHPKNKLLIIIVGFNLFQILIRN